MGSSDWVWVRWLALWALWVRLASCARSAPQLVFPLQLQRPPVARVNETWSWTLLADTFNASSGSTVTLSTRSLPKWATFDATTATFTGLPRDGDVGETIVSVQANATGVAKGKIDRFTLIVNESPVPYVDYSIAAQLPIAAGLGGGATYTLDGALKVPPQWSFSLGFEQYTFQDADYNPIYYTAYQTGSTDLPSWMKFDNRTVTFDGVAPSTPGEYSFTIFGSNSFGYGDVEQTFKLSVAQHSFELLGDLPNLNTSAADQISYTIPLTSLYIDNLPISQANLSSIAVDLTNATFFAFNNQTRQITGTTPDGLAPANLTLPVTIVDSYGDIVQATISLVVLESLFVSTSLPPLAVVASTSFSDDLSAYTTNKLANYSAVISPDSAQSWVQFDPETLLLTGFAPATVQTALVSLSAYDGQTGLTSEATLELNVALASAIASSTSAADSAAGAIATGTSSAPDSTSSAGAIVAASHAGLSHTQKLAIGLSLGLLLGLLLLALLALCCYRRFFGEGEDDRRIRRSGSSRVLQNDPDQAAGGLTALADPPLTPRTPNTLVGSDHGKEGKAEGDWGQFDDSAEDSQPQQQQHVVAMHAQLPHQNVKTDSPKRFDLLGMFRGGAAQQPKADPRSAGLTSSNSLYGLGIDGQRQHNIVVVTDDVAGGTYAPGGESSEERIGGESDIERSSTWESGASSSLFYSEHSHSEDSAMVRTSNSLPRANSRMQTSASAPRQRRDFLPLPNQTAESYAERSSSPISRSSSPVPGAIRLVGADSRGSFLSTDGSELESEMDPTDSTHFQGGVPMRHHAASSSFGSSSLGSSSAAGSSLMSVPAPRYLPFTNEHRTASHSSDPQAHVSQSALELYPNHRASAHEDAFEPDELENLSRSESGPYHPNIDESPTTSAVFYPHEGSPDNSYTSQRSSANSSATATSYHPTSRGRIRDAAPSPRPHQQPQASGAHLEAHRMALTCNEPFKFVPMMNPPPTVSLNNGSPSRSGRAGRSTYFACLDIPGRPPLPQWLNYNPTTYELHGCPRRLDLGSLPVLIVEKKMPGSPTRQGPQTAEEVVVARYMLEVGLFEDQTIREEDEDDGELAIITF